LKGDVVIVEEHHIQAAQGILPEIIQSIKSKETRYIISVAGESGSGKSETGQALANELEKSGIKAVVLGQDDYFVLPPKSNDAKRREDPSWLGPHLEVRLDFLEGNIKDAIAGADQIQKPLIDYHSNSIEEEQIDLREVKVIIAEGTYTSLLKHVDTRIFIARNRLDTLEHRKKRNRGDEVGDPFIENILKTEHKIIAGHRQLADFVITKDYDVIPTK
jgi:uridine kinase